MHAVVVMHSRCGQATCPGLKQFGYKTVPFFFFFFLKILHPGLPCFWLLHNKLATSWCLPCLLKKTAWGLSMHSFLNSTQCRVYTFHQQLLFSGAFYNTRSGFCVVEVQKEHAIAVATTQAAAEWRMAQTFYTFAMKLRNSGQTFAKSVIKTLLCIHSPFVSPPLLSTRASCVTAVIYMVEAEGVL